LAQVAFKQLAQATCSLLSPSVMSFMSSHCGLLLLVALGVFHAEGIGVEARATHSRLVRKEEGQLQKL